MSDEISDEQLETRMRAKLFGGDRKVMVETRRSGKKAAMMRSFTCSKRSLWTESGFT